jgi:Spy/CpxP family protein refolding chaperone
MAFAVRLEKSSAGEGNLTIRKRRGGFAMSLRTMITLGGIAASILLIASLAPAQGHMAALGWGPGEGMAYWNAPNLTPEQIAQMNKFRSEYYNDTATVRGQLVAKHAELRALLTNPDATSAQISAKEREILQISTQFGEKRIAYEAKLRSVLTKEQLAQMATNAGYGWGRGGRYRYGMEPAPWYHHRPGNRPGMGPGPGDEPGPAPAAP